LDSRSRSIRRDVNVPYYEQLKHLILEEITAKELQPGDLLPSEIEMCERYDVSRTVVRQAVGELVNEGLLQRMRGKGTYLAKPKLREQFMESTVGFFEDMTASGYEVESRVLSCQLTEPSPKVVEALELDSATSVIELVRLRSVNHEVVAFTRSYLRSSDPALLQVLTNADLGRQSLYRVLQERWGLVIASGRRSLEAAAAEGVLAQHLGIRAGDPVLSIESVGRDVSGAVVEYFQAWHRADRTRIEIDVVRDPQRGNPSLVLSHE